MNNELEIDKQKLFNLLFTAEKTLKHMIMLKRRLVFDYQIGFTISKKNSRMELISAVAEDF